MKLAQANYIALSLEQRKQKTSPSLLSYKKDIILSNVHENGTQLNLISGQTSERFKAVS